jgi:phosphate starvation-inducible PhoH-like protein
VDISPRTENHDAIVQTIKTNTITVLHGCAGSGKSLFSLIMGLKYLKDNRFDKIILLRPFSTVGKSVGYLPGDLSEKYMPYASPLSSALVELIGEKEYENLVNTKKLCFEPISMTRGANFKNAYIIMDEAQNTTKTEILTLLTRICYNTKFVITGDTSQDDRVINRATPAEKSGLEYAIERLADNSEIGFVKMVKADIQRNKIVGDIIDAFE